MGRPINKLPSFGENNYYFLTSRGDWSAKFSKDYKTSKPPVIVSEDHGAIVPPLETLRVNKMIPENNRIVHFDYHHDIYSMFDSPFHECLYYKKPTNEEEALNTIARKNNFLLTLVGTGLTSDISWVLPEFIHISPMINQMNGPVDIIYKQSGAVADPHHLLSKNVFSFHKNLLQSPKEHNFWERYKRVDSEEFIRDRTFNYTAVLFKDALIPAEDRDMPVIIDIDMDWFGAKHDIDPLQLELNGMYFKGVPSWNYEDSYRGMTVYVFDGHHEKHIDTRMCGWEYNLTSTEVQGATALMSRMTGCYEWRDMPKDKYSGYENVPENVLTALVDMIKCYKNISAICIALEKSFSIANDIEERLLKHIISECSE